MFVKEYFEKVNFEKKQQQKTADVNKCMNNFPACKDLNISPVADIPPFLPTVYVKAVTVLSMPPPLGHNSL